MTLVQNIFQCLNANCNYAVLRNYDGLPEKLNSRDIDILISRNDFKKHKKQIINIIVELNYKITTYFRSDRMLTIICALNTENSNELIQFDFLFQTSLFGLIIIDADQMLKSRIFNGNIYHVTKEYEFLDKYLYLKLLNKPYPEKYQTLRFDMEQSTVLGGLLKKLTGIGVLDQFDNLSPSAIKRKIGFFNLKKQPMNQLSIFVAFWWYYLKNRIFYKGYSIGFTGPDGSGKTTIIDAITEEFRKTYQVEQFHFRPTLTPNLGDAAHKAKLTSKVDDDFSNPHRASKTGSLSSLIRLMYYSVDYIVGYFLRVRPFLHKRSIVIFDRYYTDIIADSRRSRIFLNSKFLYGYGQLFIPRLDYNILLTADKEAILSRKQELTGEGIDQINKKLTLLARKKNYYLVLNNNSPAETVQNILTIVFEEQHKKNMKRINK